MMRQFKDRFGLLIDQACGMHPRRHLQLSLGAQVFFCFCATGFFFANVVLLIEASKTHKVYDRFGKSYYTFEFYSTASGLVAMAILLLLTVVGIYVLWKLQQVIGTTFDEVALGVLPEFHSPTHTVVVPHNTQVGEPVMITVDAQPSTTAVNS